MHGQDPLGTRRAGVGCVVNSLGQPIDGKGPINAELDVIEKASGVPAQVRVAAGADGLKAIDAMVPDRPRPARAHHRRPPDWQDGGGIDTIINQKGKDLICIYGRSGRRRHRSRT
jgi:F-type H+-transporting ATPase subunit alpha